MFELSLIILLPAYTSPNVTKISITSRTVKLRILDASINENKSPVPCVFTYPGLTVIIFNILFTVAGVPSICLAPWLETKIASAPCFTPNNASSTVIIPFNTIGSFVIL